MVMLTRDDQRIIRHYILLTIARKALEGDLLQLEKAKLRLLTPYVELTTLTLDQISKEMAPVKREMAKCKIKVEKKQNDGLFTEYYYMCRGYQGSIRILNTHLRNQVYDYITSCFTTNKLTHNQSV